MCKFSWGGKKLLALLHKRHPRWLGLARSTACDILSRHGMVPTRHQRRRIGHPGKPTTQILAPNDVWAADYEGCRRSAVASAPGASENGTLRHEDRGPEPGRPPPRRRRAFVLTTLLDHPRRYLQAEERARRDESIVRMGSHGFPRIPRATYRALNADRPGASQYSSSGGNSR